MGLGDLGLRHLLASTAHPIAFALITPAFSYSLLHELLIFFGVCEQILHRALHEPLRLMREGATSAERYGALAPFLRWPDVVLWALLSGVSIDVTLILVNLAGVKLKRGDYIVYSVSRVLRVGVKRAMLIGVLRPLALLAGASLAPDSWNAFSVSLTMLSSAFPVNLLAYMILPAEKFDTFRARFRDGLKRGIAAFLATLLTSMTYLITLAAVAGERESDYIVVLKGLGLSACRFLAEEATRYLLVSHQKNQRLLLQSHLSKFPDYSKRSTDGRKVWKVKVSRFEKLVWKPFVRQPHILDPEEAMELALQSLPYAICSVYNLAAWYVAARSGTRGFYTYVPINILWDLIYRLVLLRASRVKAKVSSKRQQEVSSRTILQDDLDDNPQDCSKPDVSSTAIGPSTEGPRLPKMMALDASSRQSSSTLNYSSGATWKKKTPGKLRSLASLSTERGRAMDSQSISVEGGMRAKHILQRFEEVGDQALEKVIVNTPKLDAYTSGNFSVHQKNVRVPPAAGAPKPARTSEVDAGAKAMDTKIRGLLSAQREPRVRFASIVAPEPTPKPESNAEDPPPVEPPTDVDPNEERDFLLEKAAQTLAALAGNYVSIVAMALFGIFFASRDSTFSPIPTYPIRGAVAAAPIDPIVLADPAVDLLPPRPPNQPDVCTSDFRRIDYITKGLIIVGFRLVADVVILMTGTGKGLPYLMAARMKFTFYMLGAIGFFSGNNLALITAGYRAVARYIEKDLIPCPVKVFLM
ncbi:hypothetical protein HDU96_001626 [Phlyctochytrium bullatum]|nr:hypothetical protein HDU96_001626 [Phlyctochytrium bullatum]